jgi:hypothetical protein
MVIVCDIVRILVRSLHTRHLGSRPSPTLLAAALDPSPHNDRRPTAITKVMSGTYATDSGSSVVT